MNNKFCQLTTPPNGATWLKNQPMRQIKAQTQPIKIHLAYGMFAFCRFIKRKAGRDSYTAVSIHLAYVKPSCMCALYAHLSLDRYNYIYKATGVPPIGVS
jgi:hypothetical protein